MTLAAADFPPSMQRIIALIGLDSTRILVEAFGGEGLIYIPMRAREGNRIVELIGFYDAAALCGEYGGAHIRFPKCANAFKATRNAEINRLLGEGWTVGRVADHMRLSVRRIQMLKR